MTTLIIMIIYNSKNSNNNKNDNENDYNNNCHTKSDNYALINLLLQSPPPFTSTSIPTVPVRVGNLNLA